MAFYRLIFHLRFNLSPLRFMVVALNREGQCSHSNGRPRPPIKRTIDLRAGDQILADGQRETIEDVVVWSEWWLTEEQAMRPDVGCGDGYLFRPRRQPIEKPTPSHTSDVASWDIKYESE